MKPLREYLRSIPAAHALLALVTLVTLGGSGPAPARGRPAEVERFAGTVKAVDLRGGTLDLVTGVGLSLRMRRVHLPAPLKVKGAAPESAAVALTPGCIVRIECRATPAGTAASTVELLRAAPRGMKP